MHEFRNEFIGMQSSRRLLNCMMPGRDFEDTYAPTPNHASTRLMQALSLMPHPVNKKKFTRMCWDVSTAYLCAKLPMDKAEVDAIVLRTNDRCE